jgi:hypothetical protein
MPKTQWKNKILNWMRRLQGDQRAMQPEEFIRKFSISIFTGFVTAMIGMTLLNQINWFFVVPLSVAALLAFTASQS